MAHPSQLEFEVKEHSKASTKTKFVVVDLEKFTFSIGKKRKKQADKDTVLLPANMLESLEKDAENEKQLRVHWKLQAVLGSKIVKRSSSKPVVPSDSENFDPKRNYQITKWSFKSIEERERFYEAAWFARFEGKLKPDATEDISVFIGTWNLGNAAPPASLDAWIPKNTHDVYFISLQESNFTATSGSSGAAQLTSAFKSHFGSGYTLVEECNLWEIRLYLFVKNEHVWKLSNLENSKEATGIAHVIGNKGGVGVSFKFFETNLCFVSSHLAAHQTKVEMRNSNFEEIIDGMKLGQTAFDLSNHFHHVFWTGDLNYRIDLERPVVIDLIAKKDWATLLEADQLLKERKANRVFVDWNEGQINFPPTYRYNRGDRTYSEEKMRIPAWCDRVLWKSLPDAPIAQLSYNCADQITTSDHSPVFSTFRVAVKLPNTPHVPEMVNIHITNLHGADLKSMDSNGLSDPYVVFTAPYLSGEKQTVIIEKSLHPQYQDEEVPILKPIVSNREFLRSQYLYIIVRDYDRASKDDEMGQCVIPLRGAIDQPMPFTARVFDRGFPFGTLSGTLHVSWGKARAAVSSPRATAPAAVTDLLARADAAVLRDLLMSFAKEPEPFQRSLVQALLTTHPAQFAPTIQTFLENPPKRTSPRKLDVPKSSSSSSSPRKHHHPSSSSSASSSSADSRRKSASPRKEKARDGKN